MTDDIKRIDAKEFRELGFLQEANRLFFHPRGLALEIIQHADGSESFGGVWDYRDDPEGVVFSDGPDVAKAMSVDAEYQRHSAARYRMFKDTIQPVGMGLPSSPSSGAAE